MRTIRCLLIACSGGLIGLMSFMQLAHADTLVPPEISVDTVWEKARSPYVIAGHVKVQDSRLTIQPGTIIVSADPEGFASIRLFGTSTLQVGEPSGERVSAHRVGFIVSNNGVAYIYNTDTSYSDGFMFYHSKGLVASSTTDHSYAGIAAFNGDVVAWGNRFENNRNGLIVSERSGPAMIKITGSIIANNMQSVSNSFGGSVQAAHNWWGSPDGPAGGIQGNVIYSPWLTQEPLLDSGKTLEPNVLPECCSNVLFLPGLEASRIYEGETWPNGGSYNRLWEPNRNDDVRKLFLDTNGSSTNSLIYSGEPMDKALGMKGIYGSFMSMMDSLVREGYMNQWKAFGYDWRKPIPEVVAGRERKATTTQSLVETVESLAAQSKTGKVSLVAHSNGGLVAKYLVKALSDSGKSGLIDSVVSVAVPYAGTPQAIAALLHGYDQSFLGGIIMKKSVARELGKNMASAYSLLPSRSYFSSIVGPTVVFASTTIPGLNEGTYGLQINTHDQQTDFIADKADIRPVPEASDTARPIRGNSLLLGSAGIVHDILDAFMWPASIGRWAVVGWNKDTTKNISYSEKIRCFFRKCSSAPVVEVGKTSMGDGTVVVPSAAYASGTVISTDLNSISKIENKDIAHANILESQAVQNSIRSILTANPADSNTNVLEEIEKMPGMSIGAPDYSKEATFLVVSTHSPVDLHVYDRYGNHTGIAGRPPGIEDDVLTMIDKEIVGSSFEQFDDGFGSQETYITLPDDTGERYEVVINGAGFGEFSYEVERRRGSEILDKVEFSGLAVTPLLVATTSVTTKPSENDAMPILASSSPALNLDFEGDGVADINVTAGSRGDGAQALNAIRKMIVSLAGNTSKGDLLIKRLEKIESDYNKSNPIKAERSTIGLYRQIDHVKSSQLSESDRVRLLGLLDSYLSQLE